MYTIMKKSIVCSRISIPCLLDITLNYNNLLNSGYNKMFLKSEFTHFVIFTFLFVVDDCFSVNINVKYPKKI